MNDLSSTAIKDLLRQAGLRATPARIATLALMSQISKPLSHAEVSKKLADMDVDKATVFRNLNDLTNANLLRRTELGDHVWRFEMTNQDGHEASPHPHFLCIDCGEVSCVDKSYVSDPHPKLSEEIGTVSEIVFRGHCNNCE